MIENVEKSTIGIVVGVAAVSAAALIYYAAKESAPLLDPITTKDFKIKKIVEISHNVKQFRFELPKNRSLDLPLGRHVQIKIPGEEGKFIVRNYTPVFLDKNTEKGYFDLVIKIYPDGRLTQILNTLSVGDTLPLRGPAGRFEYTPNVYGVIGMIAGGTGITPMYQLMKQILENPNDNTQIQLIFANSTEEDILLADELNYLEVTYENLFITHVISKPETQDYKHTGRINKNIIEQYMPPPAGRTTVLICGPTGFCKTSQDILKDELNYDPSMIYKF